MENKEAIIKAFVKTLQLTRIGEHVMEGEYYKEDHEETALLYIENRFTGRPYPLRVRITGDSGLSIIKDILYALEE